MSILFGVVGVLVVLMGSVAALQSNHAVEWVQVGLLCLVLSAVYELQLQRQRDRGRGKEGGR